MTAESTLRGLAGLALMVGLAYAFSSNRRAISWRLVAIGTILQVLFALVVLNTAAGRNIFNWISRGFVVLFGFAAEGAAFVFGPLGRGPGAEGSLGFFFAFQVLPIVIFFASLMAILYYLGIMQRVVQGFAWVMARLLGTSGAESLSVSASTFIGQTEAPLVIRPYLPVLTTSELYTIMMSGMAHIAGSVMAAYVTMLAAAYAKVSGTPLDAAQVNFAGHFLAASIMAAPATMVVAKMLVPETESPVTMGTVRLKIEKGYSNIIEAAAGGAGDGLRLALNIGAMLIAFIACIAVINSLLGWAGDVSGLNAALRASYGNPLSLELLFGFIFQFVAFAIGVPWSDAMPVGEPDGHQAGPERIRRVPAHGRDGGRRNAVREKHHHRHLCALRVRELLVHRHPDRRPEPAGREQAGRHRPARAPRCPRRHDRHMDDRLHRRNVCPVTDTLL